MIGRSGEVVESLIELFVGNTANCTLMASLLGAIDLPLPCNICYLKIMNLREERGGKANN